MKLILALCLFACVGFAVAGYGSGTPGYYDPWTYYGGYDRYSYRRPQPRPYGGERRYDYGNSYDQYYRYGQYGQQYGQQYSQQYGNYYQQQRYPMTN